MRNTEIMTMLIHVWLSNYLVISESIYMYVLRMIQDLCHSDTAEPHPQKIASFRERWSSDIIILDGRSNSPGHVTLHQLITEVVLILNTGKEN